VGDLACCEWRTTASSAEARTCAPHTHTHTATHPPTQPTQPQGTQNVVRACQEHCVRRLIAVVCECDSRVPQLAPLLAAAKAAVLDFNSSWGKGPTSSVISLPGCGGGAAAGGRRAARWAGWRQRRELPKGLQPFDFAAPWGDSGGGNQRAAVVRELVERIGAKLGA